MNGIIRRIKLYNKAPIADDFYPSEETRNIAHSKGYLTVDDPSEIQAFINHNKINNTQWADFNPVFLRWLEQKYMETLISKSKSLINHVINNSNHDVKSLSKILCISEKKLLSFEKLTKKDLKAMSLLAMILEK